MLICHLSLPRSARLNVCLYKAITFDSVEGKDSYWYSIFVSSYVFSKLQQYIKEYLFILPKTEHCAAGLMTSAAFILVYIHATMTIITNADARFLFCGLTFPLCCSGT